MQDAEIAADDPNYISMVEISFPIAYSESFFEIFSMDNWFKIKGVLKDMKQRRGKKGLKTYLRFAGFANNSIPLVFPLLSLGDRQYSMGLEKLEYMVDIVTTQLKSLPANTEQVWYSYSDEGFRWTPNSARANGANYLFKNDEWKSV